VSITEELLWRKSGESGLGSQDYDRRDPSLPDRIHFILGDLTSAHSELILSYASYTQSADSFNGGSARRKAATYTGQNREEKWIDIHVLTEYESTIPVLGREKTFHAYDREANVIGITSLMNETRDCFLPYSRVTSKRLTIA
jgi:hypothetical protein